MGKRLNPNDYIGKSYEKLTIVEWLGRDNWGGQIVKCQCECGNYIETSLQGIKSGHAKSCGCYQRLLASKRLYKHGKTHNDIYNVWAAMIRRCTNPNVKEANNYIGRGISVCSDWRNDFQKFYDYVRKLPHYKEDGYSLDRIDNNGNYEPGNVKWSTKEEQANNRRSNHFIIHNGKTQSISQWARELGMNQSTLYMRLNKYEWDIEKALTKK